MKPENNKKKPCPHFGVCGGCQLLDVPYAQQLAQKQELLRDEFVRAGVPEVQDVLQPILKMKNPDHYRNKVTAVFAQDARGRIICGTYQAGARRVLPVKSCRLDNTAADRIVLTIAAMLPSFHIKPYDPVKRSGSLRYAQIRTARGTGQIMVTLVTASPSFPSRDSFVRTLCDRHPEITTIVQNINSRTDAMILADREKVLYGEGHIEDILCGRRFMISSTSFYQVNPLQTEKLYNVAVDFAGLSGRESILDAYCGIGTIGIIAAAGARFVQGVELNAAAVEDACRNAAKNGLKNIRFTAADATAYMEELASGGREPAEKPDVIFLDPPRAGATPRFLKAAASLSPKKIVYISCEPSSLARDLAILKELGYRAVKAVPVDMFPHTWHIETIVLLQKLNS